MRHEPALDRNRLAETVRAAYEIPVDELTFVPVGYAAACYVVRAGDEPRHFVKLWPDTAAGREAAARRAVTLPLLHALDALADGPLVPAPVPSRDGALWADLMGAPFAVFPFITGRTPDGWPDWPPDLWDQAARTLASIHGATGRLGAVLPAAERFLIPFETDLLEGLDAISGIEGGRRPLAAVRDVVLPRREETLDQVSRLRALGDACRRLRGPLVLCHTDFGGDNLLITAGAQLAVLDWDDATIAPPEHDLWSAVDGRFDRFLEVYGAAGGRGPLHVDHFAFALLRRSLADMTARVVRLLRGEGSAVEEAELLDGIDRWGFSQWAALDARVESVAAALDAAQLPGV